MQSTTSSTIAAIVDAFQLSNIELIDTTPDHGTTVKWTFENADVILFGHVFQRLCAHPLCHWTSPPYGDYDDEHEYRLYRLPSGTEAILVDAGSYVRTLSGTLSYIAWSSHAQAEAGMSEIRLKTQRDALRWTLSSNAHHLPALLRGEAQSVEWAVEWLLERAHPGAREQLSEAFQKEFAKPPKLTFVLYGNDGEQEIVEVGTTWPSTFPSRKGGPLMKVIATVRADTRKEATALLRPTHHQAGVIAMAMPVS
ncbi:MAG: hypothetical protein EOM91_12110 [Sphingobacteriia bacterium]|jgi:hypothetical protein|nr:hypothetical protein [Sphingobacteriia bacterium]